MTLRAKAIRYGYKESEETRVDLHEVARHELAYRSKLAFTSACYFHGASVSLLTSYPRVIAFVLCLSCMRSHIP